MIAEAPWRGSPGTSASDLKTSFTDLETTTKNLFPIRELFLKPRLGRHLCLAEW